MPTLITQACTAIDGFLNRLENNQKENHWLDIKSLKQGTSDTYYGTEFFSTYIVEIVSGNYERSILRTRAIDSIFDVARASIEREGRTFCYLVPNQNSKNHRSYIQFAWNIHPTKSEEDLKKEHREFLIKLKDSVIQLAQEYPKQKVWEVESKNLMTCSEMLNYIEQKKESPEQTSLTIGYRIPKSLLLVACFEIKNTHKLHCLASSSNPLLKEKKNLTGDAETIAACVEQIIRELTLEQDTSQGVLSEGKAIDNPPTIKV